ncbi:MAG: hypothetical protein DLM55_04150 [Acidimicrobiales bacterium]|nr:MAG: hypothetical protein DLM55_04150 [Acidimicrobiales bacterium]
MVPNVVEKAIVINAPLSAGAPIVATATGIQVAVAATTTVVTPLAIDSDTFAVEGTNSDGGINIGLVVVENGVTVEVVTIDRVVKNVIEGAIVVNAVGQVGLSGSGAGEDDSTSEGRTLQGAANNFVH